MPLHLRVLGVPRVEWEGGGLEPPLSKPASLLLYLACRHDWVSRSKLAFLYRPDVGEKEALAYLRKLVFRARQFAWAQGLEVEEGRIRWQVETDLDAFDGALAEERWGDALGHYRGDFLAGFDLADAAGYEAWLELTRSNVKRGWRDAALGQAARCSDEGAFLAAVRLYEDLLQDDPLDEVALRGAMSDLQSVGHAEEALKRYRTFAARLRSELGVQVSASTATLAQHIQRDLAQPDVTTKPSLPRATTKFFGRTRELGEIETLLARPDVRLIVLHGLGGMGKTRLALEAAARFGPGFAGVFFVPLETVDESALSATLLQGLGAQMLSAPSPKEQLVRRLGSRRILLLLDTFEHLTAGTPLLAELLTRCPNLRLLVTSRVRVALSEAWTLQVTGLGEAGEGDYDDARALFTERAQHVQTQFLPEDESHVRRLCQLVVGSPLALELTAPWTRLMPLEAIIEALQRDLDLLQGSQRGLDAVFERSWGLLSCEQQTLLCKLSVFAAGADPAAIQAVTGAPLTALAALLDASLLFASEGRYSLHPLTVHFVRQRAEAQPEHLESVRRAHARYFLTFLKTQGRRLHGGEQMGAFRALEERFADVRTAWRYAVAQRDAGAIGDTNEALYWFFVLQSRFAEASQFNAQAFAAFDSRPEHNRVRGRLLMEQASLLIRQGQLDEVEPLLDEATHLLDATNDAEAQMAVRQTYAALHARAGRYAAAKPYIKAAEARLAGLEARWQPHIFGTRAIVEAGLGNRVGAFLYFGRTVRLCKRLGNALQLVLGLYGMGDTLLVSGRLRRARSVLNQALGAAQKSEYSALTPHITARLAQLEHKLGKPERATTLANDALAHLSRVGDQVLEGEVRLLLADVYAQQNKLERAEEQLGTAVHIALPLQHPTLLFGCALTSAHIYAHRKQNAEATYLLDELSRLPLTEEQKRAVQALRSAQQSIQQTTQQTPCKTRKLAPVSAPPDLGEAASVLASLKRLDLSVAPDADPTMST